MILKRSLFCTFILLLTCFPSAAHADVYDQKDLEWGKSPIIHLENSGSEKMTYNVYSSGKNCNTCELASGGSTDITLPVDFEELQLENCNIVTAVVYSNNSNYSQTNMDTYSYEFNYDESVFSSSIVDYSCELSSDSFVTVHEILEDILFFKFTKIHELLHSPTAIVMDNTSLVFSDKDESIKILASVTANSSEPIRGEFTMYTPSTSVVDFLDSHNTLCLTSNFSFIPTQDTLKIHVNHKSKELHLKTYSVVVLDYPILALSLEIVWIIILLTLILKLLSKRVTVSMYSIFNEELILSNLYEILEVTDSSITLQNMRDNKKLIVTGTFHSIHLQYGCNEYTAYTITKLHRVVTRL